MLKKTFYIKIFLTSLVLLYFNQKSLAKDFTLESPDKKIKATINVSQDIFYAVSFLQYKYILPSQISMTLANGVILGKDPVLKGSMFRAEQKVLIPLYGINKEIKENFNELTLDFVGNYSVIFRTYNEGFAWRFVTNIPGEMIVTSERSDFQFADNYRVYFHPNLSESFYRRQKISDFSNKPNYSSLPVLIKTKEKTNILIHEADVFNYPCLTLQSDSSNVNLLRSNHAAYPKKVVPGGHMNFNLVVKEKEKYITKTVGKRTFPWRIIAFAEEDKSILNNELVYLLAAENRLADASWIKPGKAAWDWWNALNLDGVAFKTGFNTETYKYYIDFAAANHIEYVNLDEGWSDQFNLLKTTDNLDMKELIAYAKKKKVGLILWCVWWTLDKQINDALNQFERWEISGLKVDFMDRDDQVVVEFHERLLQEAAKRKLLINFHGAYHPNGLARTYPNQINVEGVRGLEWDKFDAGGTTAEHAVTIPFIRMFAGSMDYTPGAMSNYNRKDWKQINDRPMSQGTRCQQLAMYIVYYAPLQMISDSPTAYEKEPEYLKFLSDIPTIWDETVPLLGSVGQYVTVARRNGWVWYLGSMTNQDSRKIKTDLSFLKKGKTYETEIFADGLNAERVGNDYRTTKKIVNRDDSLILEMASGGGYVAKFTEQ